MTRKHLLFLLLTLFLMGAGYFVYAWIRANAGSALSLIGSPDEDVGELLMNNESPFSLPEGFKASIFARDVPGARVLARDPQGVMVVSMMSEGQVVALPDDNTDGVADRSIPVLSRLNAPHGILFRDNKLYVAETNAVSVYDYDPATYAATNRKKLIDLPSGKGHASRTLHWLSTPSGEQLLVAVGSSCNVCDEENPYRAAIVSMHFDGSDPYVYARGLRNTVFMETHPVTGELWGTDMGRDLLGDDIPPDEINIIKEDGNYGWPICFGKNVHDGDFDTKTYIRAPCTVPFEVGSHIDIPAHSAPLGLAFFPEEGWPEALWHDALVAYHGSWNRSTPTGYKIVRMKLTDTGAYEGVEDFMTGFIKGNDALGRPVDIMIEPGGTIYVSDDRAGVVYRIAYMP